MLNFKQTAIIITAINSVVWPQYAIGDENGEELGEVTQIQGNFNIWSGDAILSKQDYYTVTRNSNILVSSNYYKTSTLIAEKPVIFEPSSTLKVYDNARVEFNGGVTFNGNSIEIGSSLYSNGTNWISYDNYIKLKDTKEYNLVSPKLKVKGNLTLRNAIAISNGNIPPTIEIIDANNTSTIDISELTAVNSGINILPIENTIFEYMTSNEKRNLNDPETQKAVISRIEELLKSSDESKIVVKFKNNIKPKIQDYSVCLGESKLNIECNNSQHLFHCTGANVGVDFIKSAIDENKLENFSSKFTLLQPDGTKESDKTNVRDFTEKIETVFQCPYCSAKIIPNDTNNQFVSWPNDCALPLYPDTTDTMKIKSYSNFDNDNKVFTLKMNISNNNNDLQFDCGHYTKDGTDNTPNYINTLTFNNDNTGFDKQQVKLSGNQLEQIVFGKTNSWVNLDLTDITTNKEVTFVIRDHISSYQDPMLINGAPSVNNQVVNFDTGSGNYITFMANPNRSSYAFNKFKFNISSTVVLTGDTELYI